jgi:hypothetical protein
MTAVYAVARHVSGDRLFRYTQNKSLTAALFFSDGQAHIFRTPIPAKAAEAVATEAIIAPIAADASEDAGSKTADATVSGKTGKADGASSSGASHAAKATAAGFSQATHRRHADRHPAPDQRRAKYN